MTLYFLYHSTLCLIRRLLYSKLFSVNVLPFDIMSCSAFLPFDIISSRCFLLFDILSRLVFIPPFMYFRHYLPFNILTFWHFHYSTFFLSTFCPISTFCPSPFFTVGIIYFDILSVKRKPVFCQSPLDGYCVIFNPNPTGVWGYV